MELSIEEKVILVVTIVAFLSAFWFGATLASGVFTGLLSTIGTFLLFTKLKGISPVVWRFLLANPLLLDILVSGVSVWLVASTTATGIIAAASSALFSSLAVSIVARKLKGTCLNPAVS